MPEQTQQTTTPERSVEDTLNGWKDVKSELLAPTLAYDVLQRGMIVRYSATRKLNAKGRGYTLHKFFSRGGTGQPFELWGAAELNGKVKALRPNAVIYLRYDGKKPDAEGQEVHTFTVREAPNSANVPALVAQMQSAADALDREIRLAMDRERDRRRAASGRDEWDGPEPPDHTDSDIPF